MSSEPLKSYIGTLRPRISIIEVEAATPFEPTQAVRIEWWDDANPIFDAEGKPVPAWIETAKLHEGRAFVSHIVCTGNFVTTQAFEVDEDGKRHFRIKCDPGRLGAPFGDVQMFRGPQG